MPKYITVIILPLFLFACTQQASISSDFETSDFKTSKELLKPSTIKLDNVPSKAEPEKSLRSYTNEYYLYTYNYPSNLKAWDVAAGGIFQLIVEDEKEIFRVSVKDPESPYVNVSDHPKFSKMAEAYNLSLKEYVQYIWQLNKEDVNYPKKFISEIKEGTFDGQESYRFNVSKNFQDQNAHWNLSKETTFLYTVINDKIFEISFLADNQTAKEILDSLKVISNTEDLLPNQKNNYTSCLFVTNPTDRDRCLMEYARYSQEYPGNLEACKAINTSSTKDECYWNYATQIIYQKDQVAKSESEICKNINPETAAWASCYRLFAMKTKDASLCEFILETQGEISKESCKNDLFYTYANARWQLEWGFPQSDPPIVYAGSAELKGWPTATSSFHISSESLKLLPPPMQKHEDYILEIINEKGKYEPISKDEIQEVEQYNENNPMTVKVKGVAFFRMEGPPSLIFEEIVE